jgi:hypothetical protein
MKKKVIRPIKVKEVAIDITSQVETWAVNVEVDGRTVESKRYVCEHIWEIVFPLLSKYENDEVSISLNGKNIEAFEIDESYTKYLEE